MTNFHSFLSLTLAIYVYVLIFMTTLQKERKGDTNYIREYLIDRQHELTHTNS